MRALIPLLLACALNAAAQTAMLPPDPRLSANAADVQTLFSLSKSTDPITSAAAQNALTKVQGSTETFSTCAEKEENFPLRLICAWKAPEATLRRLPPAPDAGMRERELRNMAIQALIRKQSPDALATAVAALGELPELKNHIAQEGAKASPYLFTAVKGGKRTLAGFAATLLAGQDSFTEEEALALDGGPDAAEAFLSRFGQYGGLLSMAIIERAREKPEYRPLAYDLAVKAKDTQTTALFPDVPAARDKAKIALIETDFDAAMDQIENSYDWTVRTELRDKLYRFTPTETKQFARLLTLADNPHDIFTEAAETSLLRAKNPVFLPQIRQCLRSGGPNATELCARLSGFLKDKEAVPFLRELLLPRMTTYTTTELKQAQSSALKALEAIEGSAARDVVVSKLGALDGDAELALAREANSLPILLSLLDAPNLNEGNRYALSTGDGAQMAITMIPAESMAGMLCRDGKPLYALSENQEAALTARTGRPAAEICIH